MLKLIGKRIKEERNFLGMSQVDLGKKLDVVSQTVNGWEGGRRLPDARTLTVLADLFDCSVDYLIGRTDKRNAAVIEEIVGNDNIKIEMDKNYFATLTPQDIKALLKTLQDAGFDIAKLIK